MRIEKYAIRVNWSDEDEGFIATVPEFPGLSAFGETRQEAVEEAQIVLEGFIESYEEDGKKLPKPEKIDEYSGQTRLRMPKSLHKSIAESAEEEGVSMNQYMNYLLSARESEKRSFREALKRTADVFYQKAVLIRTSVFPSTPENISAEDQEPNFDQSSSTTNYELRY